MQSQSKSVKLPHERRIKKCLGKTLIGVTEEQSYGNDRLPSEHLRKGSLSWELSRHTSGCLDK